MHTNAMNLKNSQQIALQVHHKIAFISKLQLAISFQRMMLITGCNNFQCHQTWNIVHKLGTKKRESKLFMYAGTFSSVNRRLQRKEEKRGIAHTGKTLARINHPPSTCPKQDRRKQTVTARWLYGFTPTKSWPIYVKLSFGGTTIIVWTVSIWHHSAQFFQQLEINLLAILNRAWLHQKLFITMKLNWWEIL